MFARRTEWKLRPNRYSTALQAAQSRGAKLIDLTVSNPTRCGFHFDSSAILASLSSAGSLDYDPQPQGLLSSRQCVADYYNHKSPLATSRISPDQVFLTTSTSEAYSYLFRLLCDPEDQILVPRPSYPLFEFLAEIQDVQLRPYDLFYDHGWHIDVGGLLNAISERTRAVLVVNPNNPTGSFVHASELQDIEDLCIKHQLALISDEVFLDYGLEASAEASAAFSQGCLSFALSGLSKISCLPQMKLAWIVANGPENLLAAARERLEIIADTYLSVNAPIQHALPVLLGEKDGIQAQIGQRVRSNLGFLDTALKGAPHIERFKVEGGWYAVLRVPARQPDEELAVQLIESSAVVVHPGHFYDFPQDGYLVLSLITGEEQFREGITRILKHLAK
jgi:alanine-synthesizing transaminase